MELSLQHQEATKKDEDEVDLFASDEEPAAPASVKVNPAPKQMKGSSKKEASKNVESPAFTNKAECNDAEAKFHAALSQVVSSIHKRLLFQYSNDICHKQNFGLLAGFQIFAPIH